MNIILIGNKSRNQTELLCSQFNLIPIISTEILNDEKKSKSKLSIEISNVIQWNGSYLGNLYLDQLIDKMVGKVLRGMLYIRNKNWIYIQPISKNI